MPLGPAHTFATKTVRTKGDANDRIMVTPRTALPQCVGPVADAWRGLGTLAGEFQL